jgi:hypothetical protein
MAYEMAKVSVNIEDSWYNGGGAHSLYLVN